MHINIATSAIHFAAQVDHLYGIPTLRDANQSELFGPYQTKNRRAFLSYDAASKQWNVEQARDAKVPTAPNILPFPGLSENQHDYVAASLYVGKTLVPPPFPEDTTKTVMSATFLHEGARLAWLFVPELRRWELAPLGLA